MRPSRNGVAALLLAALLVASGASPAAAGGWATADVGTGADAATDETAPVADASEGAFERLSAGSGGGSATDASAGASLSPSAGSTAAAADQQSRRNNVTVTQSFGLLPDEPGTVRVTQRVSVPDRVVALNTTVPADARVVEVQGFSRAGDRNYAWDGTTPAPTVTYDLPVNETVEESTPDAAAGDRAAVDAGDWALFHRPNAPTTWRYAGEAPGFHVRATTDGPGAVGEWLVFLGDHRVYERRAHDQHFRLVVPDAARMTADPGDVLDSLTHASDALRVGDRDEEVFVVAAPNGSVEWGRVEGLQRGDADMWVRADRPVNHPDNAWLHEYVHSRQQFALAEDVAWFEEATAGYYAAYLTFEQDRIDYERFRARLDRGADPVHADAVLSNRSTWAGQTPHEKGALVAGDLDRRVRIASDQERSLQAIVRTMNTAPEPTTSAEFLGLLGTAGDTTVIDAGQRHVESPGNVTAWNESAHVAAFGRMPPRIGYQLPERSSGTGYRITGPYRSTWVQDPGPVVVVPGEEFVVHGVVRNAGGRAGEYDAELTVNGVVVDGTSGTVPANDSVRAAVSHTFATPGEYDVGFGGENLTVTVRRPATPDLASVSVDRTEVRRGESVAVRAVVENDADVPADTTLVATRNFEAVDSQRVTVVPEGSATVTFRVPIEDRGTSVVSVGGARPIEVEATGSTVTTTAANATDDSPADGTADDPDGSPNASSESGFGLDGSTVAVAVGALAVGLLAGRHVGR